MSTGFTVTAFKLPLRGGAANWLAAGIGAGAENACDAAALATGGKVSKAVGGASEKSESALPNNEDASLITVGVITFACISARTEIPLITGGPGATVGEILSVAGPPNNDEASVETPRAMTTAFTSKESITLGVSDGADAENNDDASLTAAIC